MAVYRKRWRADGSSYEVVGDGVVVNDSRCPSYMPDISEVYGGGFVSPIDGEYITSRSQLRRHELKHNVRQCGDYKPGEIIAMENKRIADSLRGAEGEFKWI